MRGRGAVLVVDLLHSAHSTDKLLPLSLAKEGSATGGERFLGCALWSWFGFSSGCSLQHAAEQPDASISFPKPVAETTPKKEESCVPSSTLLAMVECLAK